VCDASIESSARTQQLGRLSAERSEQKGWEGGSIDLVVPRTEVRTCAWNAWIVNGQGPCPACLRAMCSRGLRRHVFELRGRSASHVAGAWAGIAGRSWSHTEEFHLAARLPGLKRRQPTRITHCASFLRPGATASARGLPPLAISPLLHPLSLQPSPTTGLVSVHYPSGSSQPHLCPTPVSPTTISSCLTASSSSPSSPPSAQCMPPAASSAPPRASPPGRSTWPSSRPRPAASRPSSGRTRRTPTKTSPLPPRTALAPRPSARARCPRPTGRRRRPRRAPRRVRGRISADARRLSRCPRVRAPSPHSRVPTGPRRTGVRALWTASGVSGRAR
jgi:hypothetical protein